METTELSNPNKEVLYDEIRKLFVPATPEEIVRQKLIKKMLLQLSYPRELLSVERPLKDLCPKAIHKKIPTRRVDIASFANVESKMIPLLVVECKESRALELDALAQVQGYNHFIGAPFIAVAYPGGETFGYLTRQGFSYLSYLPTYQELLQAVRHG